MLIVHLLSQSDCTLQETRRYFRSGKSDSTPFTFFSTTGTNAQHIRRFPFFSTTASNAPVALTPAMADEKYGDASSQEVHGVDEPTEAVQKNWRKQVRKKAKRMHAKDSTINIEETAENLYAKRLEKYRVAYGAPAAAAAASETVRAAQQSAWVGQNAKAHTSISVAKAQTEVPDSARDKLHNPERLAFWRETMAPLIEKDPILATVPGKTLFTCAVKTTADMKEALDSIDDHNLINANAQVSATYFVKINRDLWFVARSSVGGYISSVFLGDAPGTTLQWYGRNAKPEGWKSGEPMCSTGKNMSRAKAMKMFPKALKGNFIHM